MCGFRVLGELPGGLEAVESGHHDVHQYGVGLFLSGQCHAIGAVLCLEHLESVLFQHAAELVQLGRRIIHYKYASHLSPWIKITGGLSYRRRPPSCPTAEHERGRSEEHTSELQSRPHLVCRLLLEKKNYHPRGH